MDLNIAIFDKVYIYSFSEEYLAFSFSDYSQILRLLFSENYNLVYSLLQFNLEFITI